ncbi:hypothetical protein ACFQVA_20635 [Actinomadura keratinilytica]
MTLLLRVRGNTDTERWALERRREFDHRVAGLFSAAVQEGNCAGTWRCAWPRGCSSG